MAGRRGRPRCICPSNRAWPRTARRAGPRQVWRPAEGPVVPRASWCLCWPVCCGGARRRAIRRQCRLNCWSWRCCWTALSASCRRPARTRSPANCRAPMAPPSQCSELGGLLPPFPATIVEPRRVIHAVQVQFRRSGHEANYELNPSDDMRSNGACYLQVMMFQWAQLVLGSENHGDGCCDGAKVHWRHWLVGL